MKVASQYPRIVCAQELLRSTSVFDTIIDTRTQPEFEEDHVPGAINLPVLSTEERTEIGTVYKEDSFRAKRKGAALVALNIAQHLLETLADKPRSWLPLVYCWRGGNRSGAMATIFAKIGWKVSLLEGGYRAYRREVIASIRRHVESLNFVTICGVTGSGKTRLLSALSSRGCQVLDLEALAQHRGSLLGFNPQTPQPSQKYFESLLLHALQSFSQGAPVYLESESRKIGQVQVPEALIMAMRASPCVTLTLPLASRVGLLCEEYQHFFEAPNALKAQIERLIPLHGHAACEAWLRLIDQRQWHSLVEALLLQHYDPSYQRSLPRNYPRAAQGETVHLAGFTKQDYESAAASFSG
jgi:tRNA 2-selenouridine synthase